MDKVVVKAFWAWNYDKEEEWLNRMIEDGWLLKKINFFKYTFTEIDKNSDYRLRLEYIDKDKKELKGYLEFLKENGVENIGRFANWYYFLKKDKKFEMFSDIDSKISHLNRIYNLIRILFIAYIPITISVFGGNIIIWKVMYIIIMLTFIRGIYNIGNKIKRLKNEKILFE